MLGRELSESAEGLEERIVGTTAIKVRKSFNVYLNQSYCKASLANEAD